MYYDPWFDVRIWPNEGATLDEVEEDVLQRLDEYLKAYSDKFTSSRCNDIFSKGFFTTTLKHYSTKLNNIMVIVHRSVFTSRLVFSKMAYFQKNEKMMR